MLISSIRELVATEPVKSKCRMRSVSQVNFRRGRAILLASNHASGSAPANIIAVTHTDCNRIAAASATSSSSGAVMATKNTISSVTSIRRTAPRHVRSLKEKEREVSSGVIR
ncbi:MAG: hypothetical protein BWY09_02040 [Candidatus Hydrogenedentes bacterium ADurb.Bin179]|nr:MAG: hypothetical protein BWY09_02040 [Candidatus Hydrogenedentes bacterium ADurb.Bin179]